MKRDLLLLALLAATPLSLAQTAQPLPQDKAMPALAPPVSQLKVPGTPAGTTPNLCDQTFSMVIETADTNRVMYVPGPTMFAIPFADAQDNHDKALKVLKKVADSQNKGGEYTGTFTETVTCDGRDNVRIPEGSIYVEGVTLLGTTEITDVGLDVAKQINDRYKARAKAGMKTGWNHKNANSVERNEFGQVLWEGKGKKTAK